MRGGRSDTDGTGSRLGWLLRFGVAAIVVFVGANAVVQVAERRLPNPETYYSPRAQTLVQEMDRLRDHGVRSDLLFAGTSQAARGIVPAVVGAELGMRWTGNVALPGSQATITKRWMLQEVEPRLHPRRVVWGISSIDFNGARPDPGLPHYDAAIATRPGVLGAADKTFSSDVAIARHRSQLRDPYKLLTTLQQGKPRKPPPQPLHNLLGPIFKAPASAQGQQTELSYLSQTLLGHFRVTKNYLDAYRDTLEQLRRDGVDVAVVIMPVSSQFRASQPDGDAQYEAWKQLAMKTGKAAGAHIIDLDRSMPDAGFSDYVHLTPDSARSWSAILAGKLAAIGWSEKKP
jgi:hypothetical protein